MISTRFNRLSPSRIVWLVVFVSITCCVIMSVATYVATASFPLPLVQSLGSVPPGETSTGTHEIQIHVTAPAWYNIYISAPTHFTDTADPQRIMPADRLYWRLADADDAWQRVVPGGKTQIVSFRPEDPGSSRTYRIQFQVAPTWNDPPSSGQYALELDYSIEGMADMRIAGVYPNPASVGEHVVFQCVPDFAVDEQMTFHILDDTNNTVFSHTFERKGSERQVNYMWSGLFHSDQLPTPGTYTFTITGSVSRRCGYGYFTLEQSSPVRRTYNERIQPGTDGTDLAVPFHFAVARRGSTYVGSWLALDMTLQNVSQDVLYDTQITTRLPRGWQPVLEQGESTHTDTIRELAAGAVWQKKLYVIVTPEAEPGHIVTEVTAKPADNDAPGVVAEQKISVTPALDTWAKPEGSLFARLPANSITQLSPDTKDRIPPLTASPNHSVTEDNWHAWWSVNEQGQYSTPELIATWPHVARVFDPHEAQFPSGHIGSLRGAAAVYTDAEQTRMTNKHITSFSLGAWHMQTTASLAANSPERSVWRLNLRHQNNFSLTWQREDDKKQKFSSKWRWNVPLVEQENDRIQLFTRWSTNEQPQAHVLWTRRDDGATVQIRQSIAEPYETKLSWRQHVALNGPHLQFDTGFHADNVQYGVGLAHRMITALGTWQVAGRWQVQSLGQWQPRDVYVSWHADDESQWPKISVLWQQHNVTLRTTWQKEIDAMTQRINALHRFGESKTMLHYAHENHRRSNMMATFIRDNEGMRGDAEVWQHVNSQRDIHIRVEGRIASSAWHAQAEANVISKNSTWQWKTAMRWQEGVLQTDHRYGWAYNNLHIALPGRAGVFTGMRHMEQTAPLSQHERFSTTTSYMGLWGEIQLIPQLMAGVEVAKWNNTKAVEYDAYVRYELMSNVWLQGGYRQTPNTVSLLAPERTQGGMYGRLMWAYYADW